jgi:hypothetical protein
MTETKYLNLRLRPHLVLPFEFLSFDFVSNFGFRASCFSIGLFAPFEFRHNLRNGLSGALPDENIRHGVRQVGALWCARISLADLVT